MAAAIAVTVIQVILFNLIDIAIVLCKAGTIWYTKYSGYSKYTSILYYTSIILYTEKK